MVSFTFPDITTFKWSCEDQSKRVPVENPATGQIITTIQAGDATTAVQAVLASKAAFEQQWQPLPPQARSGHLFKCADALEKHADALASLLCMENGKPVEDARNYDVNFLIGVFRYFASLCSKLPSEFYDRGPLYSNVFYEPHGVCCGILPFNWPPIHTGGKLAPALDAGNTMILKPGEQAPLTVAKIVEILQTVLPQDVVQLVPGSGPEVPQALVTHPFVDAVSFTGSTGAGSNVAKAAADDNTPVVLELGGKNAYIVFEDADFDLAVRDALDGAFFNKGEACTATSRLLIHSSIYHEFAERLAAGIKCFRVGNGMDPKTHIGPQVSRAQQERLLSYIELGKQEGAKVVVQSQLPTDEPSKGGFFVPPTLFTDVRENMRIFKEEMFGPIVTMTPFDTFEDAIHLSNSSEYGLTAAVYSRDILKANRAVRALKAGMVWVNNYNRMVLGTPFGGTKMSGYGREHSIDTLKEWSYKKTVHQPSGLGDIPEWRAVADIFGAEGSKVLESGLK